MSYPAPNLLRYFSEKGERERERERENIIDLRSFWEVLAQKREEEI